MRPVIILFAKAPVAGQVKTRLAERLGAGEAALLHKAFVADMLERIAVLSRVADIELHTNMNTDAWPGTKVARRLQEKGDLGIRMLHALNTALSEHRPQAVIVGTDAPTLPTSHLQTVLSLPADVALMPTDDGGYCVIACRRTHSDMFRGVRWSGPFTLEDTLRASWKCGLTTAVGPAWFDVDTPADLARLATGPEVPRHTAAWIEKNRPLLAGLE
ncbi:MAG TPA: TIGR04282 family arsenosugar biosynthesis glycosyltransferase [Bryobacteraceae bacterium]|nr:TIGR04282 family arsenosugar biosynthesis glycosyltransferase [Bryobacteraceae bacterium]